MFMIVGSAFSQNLESDLKLVSERVEHATSVAIDADVKVYTEKGGAVVYSTKASIYKQGDRIRNSVDALTYLQTESYYVQVDKDERAIMVVERAKTDQRVADRMPELEVKKLQKQLKTEFKGKTPTVNLLSDKEGVRKYQVIGFSGVKEAIIEIDTHRKALLMVSYAYDNENYSGQYVTVTYSKFSYDQDLSAYFNTGDYFTIQNGKVVVASKYSGYKLYTEL